MKDTDTHLLVEVVHLCTFLLALQCRQTAIKDMGRLGSYSTFNYYQHNIYTQTFGSCSWPWFIDAAFSEEE